LDVPGPNHYAIEGSFLKREYVFLRSGVEVEKKERNNGLGRIAARWQFWIQKIMLPFFVPVL
jgi:hypothetical protein